MTGSPSRCRLRSPVGVLCYTRDEQKTFTALNRVYFNHVTYSYYYISHKQTKDLGKKKKTKAMTSHLFSTTRRKTKENIIAPVCKRKTKNKDMLNVSSNSQMDFFFCASFSIFSSDTPRYSLPILVKRSVNDVSFYYATISPHPYHWHLTNGIFYSFSIFSISLNVNDGASTIPPFHAENPSKQAIIKTTTKHKCNVLYKLFHVHYPR